MTKANQIHEAVSQEANTLDEFHQGIHGEETGLTPFADLLDEARDNDPFEYVRILKLIQSAYANLKVTIDETHWTLEELNRPEVESDAA